MSTIWQTTNKTRKNLFTDIKLLLDAASAADWLGPKTAPVILKPNLVVSKPASGGATTHPEIAAGIISYLRDHGYSNISVAEGSYVGDSTTRAYRNCGYNDLAKEFGIKLIDLQKDSSVTVNIGGDEYKICRTIADLKECGGSFINLPVLKGHGQTHLTCALKNMKGCIPDSEKRRYHSLGVFRPVAMINTVITPAFAFVDGLNGDPGWEEGGSPEKRDLLLLGRDPVSIDTHACRLLNINPADVYYIGLAEELGVGSSHVGRDDIVILNGKSGSSKVSSETAETKEGISSLVDQRSACSACFGNLASALRELNSEVDAFSLLGKADGKSILIGQDFKGKELPEGKIGIGICTRGNRIKSSNSLAGCPPSKSAIKDFLISR